MAVSAWLSEAVAVRPSGPMRPYVREYHGYRQRGVTPAQHLGMPHRARHVLQRNVFARRPNVAGVAAECGYFDQAHLFRDWQQFTGLAPTDWIAHLFRNFHVTGVEDPTSLLA